MCVLYIAENGNRNDLRIDYCIEMLSPVKNGPTHRRK